jgi:hypothetical protein
MGNVPSDEGQIGECGAFGLGPILPALELADLRPLFGFFTLWSRDEVHLGRTLGRDPTRRSIRRTAVDVEDELGERIQLRREPLELVVGEVIALGGHHGPHLAQRQHGEGSPRNPAPVRLHPCAGICPARPSADRPPQWLVRRVFHP